MGGKTGKLSLDETVRREGLIKPLKPEHKKQVRAIYSGIDKKRASMASAASKKSSSLASKRMGK